MAGARIQKLARRTALATSAVLVLIALGLREIPDTTASAQEDRSGVGAGLPPSATRSSVVALARLRPASGLINVGVRPGMRIDELKVKEGDEVAADAVLAILEGHDAAQAQLDLAEARKQRSDHERSARLGAAREAAELSKRRLDEARTLYKQFGGTLKGKERYDAEMALYQVEMQEIRARLDLALAQGPYGSGGEADAAMIEAQLRLARAGLRDTEVHAPGPGRILRILAHPGETSSGASLVMGDLSNMVAEAEVYQGEVPRLHVGDPAEVDILGTRVAGKVTRIGALVGRNQLQSLDPRALRDVRIVPVTIALDRASPADRFVDMEVEATIRTSAERGPG